MVVLKELILTVSTCEGVVVLKELILTVSNLQGCGGLESALRVSTLGRCGCLERTDFNSFYFARVWGS